MSFWNDEERRAMRAAREEYVSECEEETDKYLNNNNINHKKYEHSCTYLIDNRIYYYATTKRWRNKGYTKVYYSKGIAHVFEILNRPV